MLTEREAWIEIARRFREDRPYYGICREQADILHERLITDGIFVKMRNKIHAHRSYRGGYIWRFDTRGNKSRIRFCLAQAKALTKKGRRK